MNNKLIIQLFFFVLVSTTSIAQSITKKIEPFTSLKVFDKINVQLIPSNEYKIELKGKNKEEVQIIEQNGELKIRMPLQKLLKGDDIEATLYYKKIEAIEANEGSFIRGESLLETTIFSINVKEGAQVILAVKNDKTDLKVASGGIATLKGVTKNLDVVITSGGICRAKELLSNQVTVSVNAGGEATIFATDYVDAKVRAGGGIFIYGSPKQIDQKTVIGGTIKEIKE